RKTEGTNEGKPKWKRKKGKRGTESEDRTVGRKAQGSHHRLQTEAAVTPFTNRNFPLIKAEGAVNPIAC
ncbi:Hypothetical predicted protein, partial [Marmota monax]